MVIVLSISLLSEILYAIHTKVVHASGVSLVPTHNDRHKYLKYLCLLGSVGVVKLHKFKINQRINQMTCSMLSPETSVVTDV